MTAGTLHYVVIDDSLHHSDYRAEAIDSESDGEAYIAIFPGPDARTRAEEYADWKNSERDSRLRKSR